MTGPSEPNASVLGGPQGVRRIAVGLLSIWQCAALEAIDRSGAWILEQVFGGDVELFSRSGPKEASLRALSEELAKHGAATSPATLRRMVHRHLTLRRLAQQRDLGSFEVVKASHLDAVASAPEAHRVELLLEAEGSRLSVIKFRERVPRKRAAQRRRARARTLPGPGSRGLDTLLAPFEGNERQLRSALKRLPPRLAGSRDDVLRLKSVAMLYREVGEKIESLAATAARAVHQRAQDESDC